MIIRSLTAVRFLAASAVLLWCSCGGGGSFSTGGGTPPPATCQNPLATPISNPRFSTDLLPMFQATCGSASSSCHGAVTVPGGKFSFSTGAGRTAQDVYNDLVNAPANQIQGWVRVKPGDPANSWLYAKVTGNNQGYGTQMPQAANPLCTATLENIRIWIQQGALP